MSTNMRLLNHRLTSQQLISQVLNEYNCFSIQKGSKSKPKDDDVAFTADGKKGRGRKKCTDTCGNCGWYGHRTNSCWEEGGAKHGQAPKGWKPRGKKSKSDSKKTPQANVATTMTMEPNGVWLAEAAAVKETTATITLPYAMLAHSSTAELYDSGASQHFSPFRDRFVKFESIPLRPISAADKRTFHAIGQGDLYIEIPNGSTTTQVLLKYVLYALSMGITLVSISKLAATGYSALFHDSACHVFNPRKKLVGEVQVSNGLYHVKHQAKAFAGTACADEVLTMEELHHRLSHIGPTLIREMLTKGMVEGVKLDPAHETMGQCESCENAKATCKPIGKVREPQ